MTSFKSHIYGNQEMAGFKAQKNSYVNRLTKVPSFAIERAQINTIELIGDQINKSMSHSSVQ